MERFLRWLTDNKDALPIIGGACAALVTGAWALYRFRHENRRAATNTTSPLRPSIAAAQTVQFFGISLADHEAALRIREAEIRQELMHSSPARTQELDEELRRVRGELASAAIADSMTTTFVDVMRLLYVLSGGVAADANGARVAEFLRTAHRHFGDFRSELARFGGRLRPDLEETLVDVDKQFSYLIGALELQQREDADRLFRAVRGLSEVVHSFVAETIAPRFADTASLVDTARANVAPDLDYARAMTLDDVWRLRLNLQSELLELEASEDQRLRSIAHDAKQRLGLPYFMIDHILLHRMESYTFDSSA